MITLLSGDYAYRGWGIEPIRVSSQYSQYREWIDLNDDIPSDDKFIDSEGHSFH